MNSPKKFTLTLVKVQQRLHIEEIHSNEDHSCPEWRKSKSRSKVCVKHQTDTDKLNFAVYRYRNNICLKDSEMELKVEYYRNPLPTKLVPQKNEIDLKLTEYQSLLEKRVYLLSYIDIFFKRCIALDEIIVHK